jgi:RNA polymerase sigma factor (sigma-70 family)
VGTGTLPVAAERAGRPLRSRRLLALAGDDRLVAHVRRGSEAAFEVLFERHSGGLLSFCRHMLGSREEAEDAVQHTFAAAYRDLLRDGREIRLKPWLYAIARNRCVSLLRARREAPVEESEVATAGLHEEVERRAELRELLGDLRELPEAQRAALVLSELGDLSHAEVADVLGVEAAKVKALVFRARSGLIERRHARAIACSDIREQLAVLRGGALRRRELRHHLRDCEGCRAYRDEVRRQRAMLGALLPVTPSLGLKAAVLASLGLGGGTGAAAGLGAAGAAPLGAATLAKVAVVAVVAGGGALAGKEALEHRAPAAGPPPPPPAAPHPERAASAAPAQPAGRVSSAPRTPSGTRPASHPARKDAAKGDRGLHRRVRARGPDGAPRRPASPGNRGVGLERRSPRAQGTPTYGAPAGSSARGAPSSSRGDSNSASGTAPGVKARGAPAVQHPQHSAKPGHK